MGFLEEKNKPSVFNDMAAAASQPVVDSDALYQVKKTASAEIDRPFGLEALDTETPAPERQGVVKSFFKGVPETEGYRPSLAESIAAGTTEFIRSGAKVATELWSDDTREARESMDRLRKIDPAYADELEKNTIGARPTGGQLAVRGAAALAEGALTFAPFLKAGKLALTAVDIALIRKAGTVGLSSLAKEESAQLLSVLAKSNKSLLSVGEGALASGMAKMGKFGKMVADTPSLKTAFTNSLYGSIYGGLYGAHTGETLGDSLKDAAVGGIFGGALSGAGTVVGRSLKKMRSVTNTVTDATSPFFKRNTPEWVSNAIEKGNHAVDFLRGAGSVMEKRFGDAGKNFMTLFNKASKEGRQDIGRLHLAMIDHGLIKPPALLRGGGIKYVGDDKELMRYYNKVLRGTGAYADEAARTAAIQADERLKFVDDLRKEYGLRAWNELGIDIQNPETYLPKYTKETPLKNSLRNELSTATTRAEREAIYAKNDAHVKDMVETSVFDDLKFETLEDSYQAYYDYVDFVQGGGRKKLLDNKYLQKMVRDGEASTIEEAGGKILKSLKFRKSSLTSKATSLDFEREVNLPWYDPNAARVMSAYSVDAELRLAMAKNFGAKDEEIAKLIGSFKDSLEKGASAEIEAAKFEKLIRVITGQVERNTTAEKASAFTRAIQVPKLAFAAILNIGQNLNYLLATDVNATFHGLQTVFRNEQMRKAVESGVLVNNLIREVNDYSTGGGRIADTILKYTGFTYSEMFNRSTGAVVAENWANSNFKRFMKLSGVKELDEAGQSAVLKMMNDAQEHEYSVLKGAFSKQKELIDEYNGKFQDEKLAFSAGNNSEVEKLRKKVEPAAANAIGKLQKIRTVLEDDLVDSATPLTEQHLVDLEDSIDALRSALSGGGKMKVELDVPQAAGVEFSGEEIAEAIDLAVGIKKEQLEKILARLEDKFNEARAVGIDGGDMPRLAKETPTKPKELGQSLAQLHSEIKDIDAAIAKVHNDAVEKSILLDDMLDVHSITKTKMDKENPAGLAYDKFLEDRKKELSAAKTETTKLTQEERALQELGVNVEAAKLRGFLAPDDFVIAAQSLVDKTQFSGRTTDLPAWASSPLGKVVAQFKTFSYQQMKFLAKEIKKDLMGEMASVPLTGGAIKYPRAIRTLFVLGTVFPMSGEVLGDIRSLITQEKRPTKFLDRYLADLASAGAWGLAFDFWSSSKAGKTAEFGIGVAGSDITKYLEQIIVPGISGAASSLFGDEKGQKQLERAGTNLFKQGLQQTGIGRPLSNILFPSKVKDKKTTIQSLLDWAHNEEDY